MYFHAAPTSAFANASQTCSRTPPGYLAGLVTGSIRPPDPTGLLTQTALLNRERESFGESGVRWRADGRSRAILGKLSRGEASP